MRCRAAFFDGRGAAGPFVPVVLERVEGRFVPACRKHAAYRTWIERYSDVHWDGTYPPITEAEMMAGALLAQAKISDFEAARNSFAKLTTYYADDAEVRPGQTGALAREVFTRVLEEAERYADGPCPISAVGGSGEAPGLAARFAHFRFAGNESETD